ncbi:retrovirus-related pol polyprotein from transposon TNT 1-94 [Tanacetum coccineum]
MKASKSDGNGLCDVVVVESGGAVMSLFGLKEELRKYDTREDKEKRYINYNEGRMGFKLDKDSAKECYMLGAKDLSIAWHDNTRYWQRGHVPKSRFSGVEILGVCWLDICGIIPSVILSLKSTYVAYLVFQNTRDSMGLDVPAVGCKTNLTSVSYTLTKWYQEPGYDKQWQKTEPLAKAKPKASKDKEVNQATRDSDDALICCVENTVEDRIMDSGASFHATYCKEELERFKLCSGKVRLADDKTLDITGVGSVFLRTSFGTSLIMKDVRWFGEAKESFLHNVSEDKETAEAAAGVTNGIMMLKMVPKTPLRFGVAERLSRTFRAESTGLRAEALKMLWADSVSSAYLIYRIPYVLIGLRISEEECFQDTKSHQVIRSRDITFVDSIYGATSATDSSSFTKLIQKRQVVLVYIPENLAEHDIIVVEHGLSSEITQSPGGSSDTSERSKNSGSFKDSRRSDLQDYEDAVESLGLQEGTLIQQTICY